MSRILSCPVPNNINPLSPNGFIFSIQKILEVTYFCQNVNLPSISLGEAVVSNPFRDYPLPGDKIDFGDLQIQFLVDSEMSNFKAIFNWMNGLGFPENYEQYSNQTTTTAAGIARSFPTLSDATLIILNSANVPIQTVQFFECYPSSLESLSFTSVTQDVNYLVGSASFRYSHYKFL